MKEYRVARTLQKPDWTTVEKASVEICPWCDEYRPETFAQLAYQEGKGFWVRMTCRETDPKAVYTQPDDPVCQDSCLEFFADFDPSAQKGYLNCEANSLGTMLLGFGPQRHGRQRVREMGCPLPKLTAFCTGEFWGWEGFFSLELVEQLWGKKSFAAGETFRANFYKCGDKTEVEHYCVWNRVETPNPDYHRPEYFGWMILE